MAKMDKAVIVVSAVVGSLGLLSAILGFAAESANGNATSYYRRYRRNSSAAGLGIGASLFLLVAQITVSAFSSCCGCCKSRAIPSETKRVVGIVCAVFSWILAVIAFVLFLGGRSYQGAFAAGGVLTLVATVLGITSFINTRGQPADATPTVTPEDATMPTVAPAVTKVDVKPRELPLQQQQPVMVVMDPRLSTATKITEDAQNKPGQEQPPRTDVVAVDHPQHNIAYQHPQPQPAAAPVGTPDDEQPLHTVVAMEHLQPQPAVVTTRDQLPQVPLGPHQVAYGVQPLLQPNHVQTPAQDEQPLLQPQFVQSSPHQVVYYMIVQQPQETHYPAGQPQMPAAAGMQPMFVTSTMGAHQTNPQPQVYVMQQPPIAAPQLPVAEPLQVPVQPPPPAAVQVQQQAHYPVQQQVPAPQPMFPTLTTKPPVCFMPQPPIDMPQFTDESAQVQAPAQLPLPATSPIQQAGQGQEKLSTVICKEVARAGIKLAGRALKETLFSDNNTPSTMDFIVSAVTGSGTGGGDDVGAAESGDAAAYC